MANECAYTIEKVIVGCLIRRPQDCVWWASQQMEGSCAQLRFTQLAIFIFRRAIPGIIQSQVALAHPLVNNRLTWTLILLSYQLHPHPIVTTRALFCSFQNKFLTDVMCFSHIDYWYVTISCIFRRVNFLFDVGFGQDWCFSFWIICGLKTCLQSSQIEHYFLALV